LAYSYDAENIRKSVSVDGIVTKHLVDKNRDYAQVIEERDALDNLQVAYTYGDDLISQERGGSVSYYHYDGLGSTRALTDGSETTTDSYTYEAFGSLLRSTGTTTNSYLYTGEQFDPNLGFYYLRARYQNPENGRFVTTDPFVGFQYDPVTLHKYLYANAEPINNIDPSGEMTIASAMTSISISSILSSLAISYAVSCSSEFILTSMVAVSASAPTLGCRSQGGSMRVQLQVSSSGTTHNTKGIPLSNPVIGVTTFDVREAMLNLFLFHAVMVSIIT
jgi:RHS repeat-associated protein